MELDYDAIGRRIREARKEMSLSQEALGEMVGLLTSHICHIEGGNTKSSLNSLVLIANALHVTMDRLLSDNTNIPYDPCKDTCFPSWLSSRWCDGQYSCRLPDSGS